MPITYLKLENVGLLTSVEFTFDQNVNVLVGANNTGKTTALLALADILIKNFSIPNKLVSPDSKFRVQFDPGKQEAWDGKLPFNAKNNKPDEYETALGGLGYRTFVPAMRVGTDFRSEGPGRASHIEYAFEIDSEAAISSLWSDDKQII